MLKAGRFNHKKEQYLPDKHLSKFDSAIEYERQVRQSSFKQNPIIVIPGILGSNIANLENDSSLWGDFGDSFADPKADKNLRMIAIIVCYFLFFLYCN